MITYLSLTNVWQTWKPNITYFILYQNIIFLLFKWFIVCFWRCTRVPYNPKTISHKYPFLSPLLIEPSLLMLLKILCPILNCFLQNALLFLFDLNQVENAHEIYFSLQDSMADNETKFTLFNSHRNLYFSNSWCLKISSCINQRTWKSWIIIFFGIAKNKGKQHICDLKLHTLEYTHLNTHTWANDNVFVFCYDSLFTTSFTIKDIKSIWADKQFIYMTVHMGVSIKT